MDISNNTGSTFIKGILMDKLIQNYVDRWDLKSHLNADLLNCLYLSRLAKNRELIQDDTKLYFLVKGSVHVLFSHANGKQSIVGSMEPLALVGDLDLFHEPNLQLSIVAQQDCDFLYIHKPMALKYGYDDPRFLRLIIRNLASKLTDSTYILKHNVLPLIGQVAAYLIAKVNGKSDAIDIRSKADLAELIGTTPRHLNRVLNILVDENVIAVEAHQILILDNEALRNITDS
jgi:CRP-like cAMP-binding protein